MGRDKGRNRRDLNTLTGLKSVIRYTIQQEFIEQLCIRRGTITGSWITWNLWPQCFPKHDEMNSDVAPSEKKLSI